VPFRPRSYDEDTTTGEKPEYLRTSPFSVDRTHVIDSKFVRMTRAARCLDPAIGTVLSALGPRADDTLVIYLSDNGFLYGQHRWVGKLVPYEESVRVPFVVRFPRLIPAPEGFTSSALVEDVDLAPTIAELVGFHWGADGLSLLPLLTRAKSSIRTSLLLEWCQAASFPCWGQQEGRSHPPSYWGVVQRRWSYIEYVTGESELYDLRADGVQLHNLASNPLYADTLASLRQALEALRAPPFVDTTIVTGPPAVVSPGTAVTFTYFSQSRLATYECRLDVDGVEGSWRPCGDQTESLGAPAAGAYVFSVRGTDEFGITDATPGSRAFAVSPYEQGLAG
jgi:hypothetical protein